MNLSHGRPEPNGSKVGQPRSRISLHAVVLGIISAVTAVAVWHRTGGDALLAALAGPITYSALRDRIER